jgi:hypothetical protein
MDLQKLMDQRSALSEAFDARVAELHAQPAPAASPGVVALDALAMLDRAVQHQWQDLQNLLDPQGQPRRTFFGSASAPTDRVDIVDVTAREPREHG